MNLRARGPTIRRTKRFWFRCVITIPVYHSEQEVQMAGVEESPALAYARFSEPSVQNGGGENEYVPTPASLKKKHPFGCFFSRSAGVVGILLPRSRKAFAPPSPATLALSRISEREGWLRFLRKKKNRTE